MAVTQNILTDDGNPWLVVNSIPPGATIAWTRCTPDCATESLGTGQSFQPGPTAVGASFNVTATVDGAVVETATSKIWGGTPVNTGLPSVAAGTVSPVSAGGAPAAPGTLTAGQPISPVAGTWTGGWPQDRSDLGLRACRTAAGESCVAMLGTPLDISIDPAYAGWYIGAYETRASADSVSPAIYRSTPIGVSNTPAPGAAGIRAFGPLTGPVAPLPTPAPTPTPTPTPAPAPTFTPSIALHKHALVTGGRRIVGTVACSSACKATVTFTQGKKTVTRSLSLTGGKAKTSIVAPGSLSKKRKVTVAVRFAGHPATKSAKVALS